MGMMQKLRDNTNIILWATIILFVLGFTLGGIFKSANIAGMITGDRKRKNLAGSVNDNKLKSRRFVNMVNRQISNMRKSGREINNRMYSRISDRVWKQFVNRTLMSEVVDKLGISVTGDEIYNYLRKNPPQALRQQKVFQTNGKFDYQKYLKALNNPQGNEWYPVEQRVKQSLPYQKVNNLVKNMVAIPEWEIKEQFIQKNIQMSFEMLTIPLSTVSKQSVSVSEGEIKEYYQKHKKDYKVKETRELDYVSFSIKPAASDTQLTREEAVELKERIKAGEKFQTVALENSDAPGVKENKGDLGWIGKEEMVPSFTEAAFKAQPGELVGPVLSRYGYHLIKVEDKRVENGQEEAKVKHILLEITSGPQTVSDVESKANRFAFEANEMGFAKAADSNNYEIKHLSDIKRNTRYINKLGYFPKASRFAYSNNSIGKISDVYQANDAYVICKLADINKSHFKALEKVKDKIRSKLVRKKRMNKLEEKAKDLYANNANINSLNSLNEANKFNYQVFQNKTLSEIANLEGKEGLKSALVELQQGNLSRPIESSNSYVLLKMRKKEDFDQNEYQQKKPKIKQQIIRRKSNTFYKNWMAALKEEADIFDNHMRFF